MNESGQNAFLQLCFLLLQGKIGSAVDDNRIELGQGSNVQSIRDTTSDENALLESVCDKSKIPLLGIRFGKVPKLASKILSLLVFHHSNRTLGISLKRLLSGKNKTMNIPSTSTSTSVQSNKATIDTGQMNREREIAAPCEYQLLTVLIQEIDRYHESHESQPPQSTKPQKLTDNSSDNSGWSKNKLAKRLVNEVL
ncbi:hypothetical protein FRACYDRAFT_247705 [Fragilariopsis cylindrus CCMP1102]|uniref:Uncharacterized protein n=1 Tax=Fragilariopsis cylindrus CCMP1102 TaxID=635003 RepID=A0A1E7EX48_9STRA|nr:hypothetical protein FRACYDRAFT_247705 [Fragilariopsis cylindrus CCMP1102]|eukprot:OEU10093.1 hypothetical protein FRACYDRAFT_247705 [Fragilariopsis cylindrus CCMP1102]